MRYRELGFAVAVLSAIAADVAAQEAGRSFYFGADVGVSARGHSSPRVPMSAFRRTATSGWSRLTSAASG